MFELVDAANIAEPDAFVATMEALVDAEQWMRGFAGPLHLMSTPTPGAANVIDHPPELRLLSVTLDDARNLVLTWTAVPGLTYRVQFKEHLTDPAWTDLPGGGPATSTIASQAVPLPTGARQGFFRVALLLE